MTSFFRMIVLSGVLLAAAAHDTPRRFRHGGVIHGFVPPPPPPPSGSSNLANTPLKVFDQILDHFNDSNTETWQQFYYESTTHFVPGGPVFLFISGEGPASRFWLLNSLMVDSAKENGALLLELEHRFYGDSQPTGDTTLSSLKFLSSEQALEDVANFQRKYSKMNNLEDAKWIVFGGSYAGNLAAWYRTKHPELCHAAVASSAPVLAQLDFYEYFSVVGEAIHANTDGCFEGIQKATEELTSQLQDSANWETLKSELNICPGTSIDFSNTDDVAVLYQFISDYFSISVQYGNNISLTVYCTLFTNSALTPIEQLAKFINLKLFGDCYNFTFAEVVDELSANATDPQFARPWVYQTCEEFGYYQTSETDDQPFGFKITLDYFIEECELAYNTRFDKDFVDHRVNFTNSWYGGREINATRIIFPNGSLDPWHVLSITEDISEETTLLLIPGGSHCQDMYSSSINDNEVIAAAKEKILDTVKTWVSED